MTEKTTSSLNITQEFDVIDISENGISPSRVEVCVEDSINLLVNGARVASLTITPRDLEAYAYGYLICEGIVSGIDAITDVHVDYPDIHAEVSSISRQISPEHTEIRSSGCVGIRTTWDTLCEPLGEGITLELQTLFNSMRSIKECAPLWKTTGGTHCAVILDECGNVKSAIEDMGRHNAVDKAVGTALLHGVNLSRCFMVCTGRLPAGMVAKAYRAGISIVASNTAPFSTGICLAHQTNMTLAGFVRPPRAVIYSTPERIQFDSQLKKLQNET